MQDNNINIAKDNNNFTVTRETMKAYKAPQTYPLELELSEARSKELVSLLNENEDRLNTLLIEQEDYLTTFDINLTAEIINKLIDVARQIGKARYNVKRLKDLLAEEREKAHHYYMGPAQESKPYIYPGTTTVTY